MNRMTRFSSMKTHPMLCKLFAKLKKDEIAACEKFIMDYDHLDKNGFAYEVNRWHIDKPKPKNWTSMWALVSQTNY